MRILIIATPRSGSTTLTNAIASVLKYKPYHEPYNFYHPNLASRKLPDIFPNNSVVKTLFHQLPLNVSNPFVYYKKYISKYDKVIILARQDAKAAYESFNYHAEHKKLNWHYPYEYGDMSFNLETYRTYLKWILELIDFSLELNIQITWYEDLFYGKFENLKKTVETWGIDLNIEEFKEKLDNKNKYRRIIKKNII